MRGPLSLKCLLEAAEPLTVLLNFNQLNLLLAPEVKDSEVLKKKGYGFKIEWGEGSLFTCHTHQIQMPSYCLSYRASPSMWLLFSDHDEQLSIKPVPLTCVTSMSHENYEYGEQTVLHCWMQTAPDV